MESGGGRTPALGRRASEWLRNLVGSEVPRRVLYRVEEAVVLLGLSRSQLYELIRSGQATDGDRKTRPAHTSSGDRRLRVPVDERGSGRYWWRRGVIQAREACTGRSHGSAGSRLSISGTPPMGSAGS
jgi:hypothetical protein